MQLARWFFRNLACTRRSFWTTNVGVAANISAFIERGVLGSGPGPAQQ